MARSNHIAEERLAELAPTFTAKQARAAGIPPRELYRLRDHNTLYELSRGVFRKADAPEGRIDLLAVQARIPQAVMCLLTALDVHELTDEIPTRVDVAVPRGAHRSWIDYPPVQIHHFAVDTFDREIELFEASPTEHVRVYSPARSVVDCMRLRHMVGEDVALQALREYLGRRGASSYELLVLAQALGVEGPMRRTIEVILG